MPVPAGDSEHAHRWVLANSPQRHYKARTSFQDHGYEVTAPRHLEGAQRDSSDFFTDPSVRIFTMLYA